jgi:hypothetical protein
MSLTNGTFTRNEITQGTVEGAPQTCGAFKKNGNLCLSCPKFFVDGHFSCGIHKRKQLLPRPSVNVECSICLCDIHDNSGTRTPCQHVFHESCLNTWKHHGTDNCPLCRQPLYTHSKMSRDDQFYRMIEILPLPWIYLVRRIDDDRPVLLYPTTNEMFIDVIKWCPNDALGGNAFTIVENAILIMSES